MVDYYSALPTSASALTFYEKGHQPALGQVYFQDLYGVVILAWNGHDVLQALFF